MYGGTGSGSVDTSQAPSLKDALTQEGIEINQGLWDWYTSTSEKYGRKTPASISDALVANTQYGVNEAPWAEVESANSSTFAEYGDAAIVVLSRSGGEGADLPDGDDSVSLVTTTEAKSAVGDNKGGEQSSEGPKTADVHYGMGSEGDGDYLALSQEEKDMLAGLKALKDNGTFKKIVVLLNTSNAIELDFLNPEICGVDYGIDSCMWRLRHRLLHVDRRRGTDRRDRRRPSSFRHSFPFRISCRHLLVRQHEEPRSGQLLHSTLCRL